MEKLNYRLSDAFSSISDLELNTTFLWIILNNYVDLGIGTKLNSIANQSYYYLLDALSISNYIFRDLGTPIYR